MSDMTCTTAVDLLPDLLSGALDGPQRDLLETHVADCPACAAELAFLREVRASRPEPSEGAVAAIGAALREAGIGTPDGDSVPAASSPDPVDIRRHREWRWSLPAAAAIVLALGTAQAWRTMSGPEVPVDPVAEVAVVDEASLNFFGGEDGLIAGAPVLEELSDEALQALLEEFDQWEG